MDEYEVYQSKVKERAIHSEFATVKKAVDSWTIVPSGMDESLLDPSKRIRCFIDLGVRNSIKLGRLVIEVWMDVAPICGCNFVNLCKGFDEYTYKNTPLHQIIRGVFFVAGDVVNKSGTGIYSVYGGVNSTYPYENTTLEFNGPGVVAMHTPYMGDNHSQFLITFKRLTTMNKRFVVFGLVEGSTRMLELIEGFGTKGGKPVKDIIITDCGVLSGPKVPKPETITLPPRISPASSEEVLTMERWKERRENQKLEDPEVVVRTEMIKKDREDMRKQGWHNFKFNMPEKESDIDCVNIFKKKVFAV